MDEKALSKDTVIRKTKYLNNIVEQVHRFIKKITNPMLGFKSFLTAEQTLKEIEAIHKIRKGQIENKSTALSTADQLNRLFGWVV